MRRRAAGRFQRMGGPTLTSSGLASALPYSDTLESFIHTGNPASSFAAACAEIQKAYGLKGTESQALTVIKALSTTLAAGSTATTIVATVEAINNGLLTVLEVEQGSFATPAWTKPALPAGTAPDIAAATAEVPVFSRLTVNAPIPSGPAVLIPILQDTSVGLVGILQPVAGVALAAAYSAENANDAQADTPTAVGLQTAAIQQAAAYSTFNQIPPVGSLATMVKPAPGAVTTAPVTTSPTAPAVDVTVASSSSLTFLVLAGGLAFLLRDSLRAGHA